MKHLSFRHGLELQAREVVAAIGAGGKSTLLGSLASELAGTGKKVVITTTTKIYRPGNMPLVLCENAKNAVHKVRAALGESGIVTLGRSLLPEGKLSGVDKEWADAVFNDGFADYILVEADGAAGMPVKGFAGWEPVIPKTAGLVIPILGLDALGVPPAGGRAHRPGLLAEQAGARAELPLEESHFARLLAFMAGLAVRQAPSARIVPVLNKVETVSDAGVILELATSAAKVSGTEKLIFSAAGEENPVRYIFCRRGQEFVPRVSCVLLAAGASLRMGRDKLSIRMGGKTMLGLALDNVLGSDVDEVVLVTRPGGFLPDQLPGTVKVVENHASTEGQATSVALGLSATDTLSQAVIFALADQPFIPAGVYNMLTEQFRRTLKAAVYPSYQGRRGNPVLFDRRMFPQLAAVSGDAGGREILGSLSGAETLAVDVQEEGVIFDIDTPADFSKIAARTPD